MLQGRKENDPEWIKSTATHIKSGKTDKYKKQLRELFLEYRREGLKPMEAFEKAKEVLACFETKR